MAGTCDLATSFHVRTLCSKDAVGYRNDQFYQMSLEERTQSIERLLIEVRIASQSAYFLGTFRSNLSLFVTNVHWDPTRCMSVDLSEWIPARWFHRWDRKCYAEVGQGSPPPMIPKAF